MASQGIDITTPGSPTAKVSATDATGGVGSPVWVQVVSQKELAPVPVGSLQNLTVDATAGGKALPNIPATAECCLVSLETAPIRFADDGSTPPTSTVGHLLQPPSGDSVFYWIEGRTRVVNFRAIRTTGVSANATVTYYLRPAP